jgi:glucosamine-6-phosphate deaminase
VKWEIVSGYDEVSSRAAAILLEGIREKPRAVLGLPTGSTPEGMYARIVEKCSREYHCFAGVTTFNLDEYAGVPRTHPGSYFTYMRTRLFEHVDLDPRNIHIPDGMADSLEAEAEAYEREINRAGGLDLTFLGLGRNGHIGFNEPGIAFDSRTHVVELTPSTREANAPFFPDGHVPDRAITMGIATILESRRIVLMASGEAKAEAIRRLRDEPPSPDFPASALQAHDDVLVLIDTAAASRL